MAKIILNNVQGGYDLSLINFNFSTIANELNNKVLYRNNTSGEANNLESNINCNSKRLFNLPPPTSASEPVRLQEILALTAAINSLRAEFDAYVLSHP